MVQGFNILLEQAIDDVLSSLGEPVKNQLYIRLEEDFSLQRHQIANQIDQFSLFLFRTFGPSSILLQIKIMRKVNEKIVKETRGQFRLIVSFDDFSFVSYINEMRNSFTLILPLP
jgi:hypothetical protein